MMRLSRCQTVQHSCASSCVPCTTGQHSSRSCITWSSYTGGCCNIKLQMLTAAPLLGLPPAEAVRQQHTSRHSKCSSSSGHKMHTGLVLERVLVAQAGIDVHMKVQAAVRDLMSCCIDGKTCTLVMHSSCRNYSRRSISSADSAAACYVDACLRLPVLPRV